MVNQAALHGLSQKLGDSYASAQGDVNWAFAECSTVRDSILNGDWNRKGQGDGGDLVEALVQVTGKDPAEVAELVAAMDKETKDKAKKVPQVAAAIAKIKAERLAKKAEGSDGADDVLAGLMGS